MHDKKMNCSVVAIQFTNEFMKAQHPIKDCDRCSSILNFHSDPIRPFTQISDELFAARLDFALPFVHAEGSTEDQTSSLSSSPSYSSRQGRDLSEGMELQVARARAADSTPRLPHLLMEFIGHQDKFRGRTKKNMGSGCFRQYLIGMAGGVGSCGHV